MSRPYPSVALMDGLADARRRGKAKAAADILASVDGDAPLGCMVRGLISCGAELPAQAVAYAQAWEHEATLLHEAARLEPDERREDARQAERLQRNRDARASREAGK